MATSSANIPTLINYAVASIRELADIDADFGPLVPMVEQLSTRNVSNPDTPLNDQDARTLIRFDADGNGDISFNDHSLATLQIIARRILQIAVNPTSNSEHLQMCARYFHPLLSQDERTRSIGWDLEEYMDWYFHDTGHDERLRYANELLADWQLESLSAPEASRPSTKNRH